jgi:hypothetical protein
MAFLILFIGAILVVAALRDTQGSLFSALGSDIPAFVVWAAAIVAVGAIGFIPRLSPVSKALLGLILVVLFLRNYKNILTGISNAASSGTKPSGKTVTVSSLGATPANPGATLAAVDDYIGSFNSNVGTV